MPSLKTSYTWVPLFALVLLLTAASCGAAIPGFGRLIELDDEAEEAAEINAEITADAEFRLTSVAAARTEEAIRVTEEAIRATQESIDAALDATAEAERTAAAREATATAEAGATATAEAKDAAARATEEAQPVDVTQFSIVIGEEEVTYVGPSEVPAGGTLEFSLRVTDQGQPGKGEAFATLGNNPTSPEATHTSATLDADGRADLSLPVNVPPGPTELRVARPPGVVGVIGTINVLP